ncbi:spermine oxidase-like isoform X2 [Photinus pyralis]|nr:spermine oxidase-like isoform X2 [Photinus pyralis]XP_031331461.1 spermine oxidase-like isoform X2 [Photinus pyralis]
MVKDLRLLTDDEHSPSLYHSRLKRVDWEFSTKLNQVFQQAFVGNNSEGRNMGDFLSERFRALIGRTWTGDKEQILAGECLDLLRRQIESYFAVFSWRQLSTRSEHKISAGNQHLGWNGLGYKTILDVLMKDAPIRDSVFLNKQVRKIALTPQSGALVGCADGARYNADHVIWTPSLGVLKRDYLSLFQPKLPERKIRSIQTLGFDAVAKIFIHFPRRWWNDDFQGVQFVWNAEDLQNSGRVFGEGPHQGSISWITKIYGILPVQRNPNLLLAWYCGEMVPEIERLPDRIIADGLMHTLERFVKRDYPNLTRPDKILRKNWYSDPHFRGTYSFETVESRKLGAPQSAVLSEPIVTNVGKPVLLFAGEATSSFYGALVNGAIETGFREADRIIKFYK